MNHPTHPTVERIRWHLLGLLLCALWLWATASNTAHAAQATPNEVYAQAMRIEAEVDSLKRHFKISVRVQVQPISGELQPRHVWAGTYVILLKLGKLRRKHGLPYIEPVGMEPMLEMSPNYPWAMTQRILGEIAILKYHLDIPGAPPATVPVTGKRPIDTYNKLHQISGELDALAGASTPSEAYSEAMRLDYDADAVLHYLGQIDQAVPPPRRDNALPKDALQAVFALLAEIGRLQRAHGLTSTDFKGFEMGDKTTLDDVLGLIELSLAELQRLKARLGMAHAITASGFFEENKTPADVVQLLGYVSAKLRAITSK